MSCTHLSQGGRYQIQHLHGGCFSARKIGAAMERAATTISRELRRNTGVAEKYQARVVQGQLSGTGIPPHERSSCHVQLASNIQRIIFLEYTKA
jgi:IS30 family transposase